LALQLGVVGFSRRTSRPHCTLWLACSRGHSTADRALNVMSTTITQGWVIASAVDEPSACSTSRPTPLAARRLWSRPDRGQVKGGILRAAWGGTGPTSRIGHTHHRPQGCFSAPATGPAEPLSATPEPGGRSRQSSAFTTRPRHGVRRAIANGAVSPGHHWPTGQRAASHCVLLMDPAGLKGLPGLTLAQLVHSVCPSWSLKVLAGHVLGRELELRELASWALGERWTEGCESDVVMCIGLWAGVFESLIAGMRAYAVPWCS
jgi:hypothetical protein